MQTKNLYANDLRPLLIEGKSNLFQRVLTLPGAKIHESPETSESDAIAAPPFSIYYVYQRKADPGAIGWLQLGFDRFGNIAGWVKANKTLQWNQGLTVTFKSPVDHERVLMFEDNDSLKQLVTDYNLERYNELYEASVKDRRISDSPVVAIQPDADLDVRKKFYLLPIRDFEDIYLRNERAKMLRISSIPVQGSETLALSEGAGANSESYSADVAFVIDATLSMQPYIDRTRNAVEKVYKRLAQNDSLGKIRFALVAFRDNTEAAPGIEYLVRTFVTLEQGQNPQTFIQSVKSFKAAKQSSENFIEDSYAGVKKALDGLNWLPDAARYIVLITDAGPRLADDPLSTTKLDGEQLNKLAQEKNIAVFVLHLLTPAEPEDHDSASLRYQQLSDYPGIGSLYYAVPAGDIREFGLAIDTLATQITGQIQQFRSNAKTVAKAPDDNVRLMELREKVMKLGHALRLKYLRKRADSPLPEVFDAWLIDREFKRPERTAINVCVLLTRDQLSDLHEILQQVLQTSRQGLLSPLKFLSELKSLAATVSRDPSRLGTTTATTSGRGNSLAEMGYLREYIEDLPYAGEIMTIDLDDWQSWTTDQQVAFVSKLEEKTNYYKKLHDHTDLWISLDGGPIDGNSVYPVPLDRLP